MTPEPDRGGWGWLERRPAAEGARALELARAFAACFQGGDGALALDHLRQRFLDRRLGPSASDAELRHLEGQRSVVAHIVALVERGRRGSA